MITLKAIIFFVYTFAISFLLHRFFVKRANRYQIKKANTSAERWSSQTKPILGGITFYCIFLFSIINYSIFYSYENLLEGPILGAIIVLNISFLMGLADDMLNTPPGFKLAVQIVGAVILIYFGLYINIFESLWLNYLLTGFWFVGVMNSINMLDNMDAITTSISSTILIGAIAILSVSFHFEGVLLFVCSGMLASLLAFLFFNWNPAKMYMGDNGSQFMGALLAILGIELFWNASVPQTHTIWYPALFAFLAFLIPIADTTSVTINRLMRGQSPFIGGRDHTTHHLSYLGLSDSKVALVLLSLNAIAVFFATFILLFPNKMSFSVWIVAIGGIFVLISLYAITKISKPKNR